MEAVLKRPCNRAAAAEPLSFQKPAVSRPPVDNVEGESENVAGRFADVRLVVEHLADRWQGRATDPTVFDFVRVGFGSSRISRQRFRPTRPANDCDGEKKESAGMREASKHHRDREKCRQGIAEYPPRS